MLRDRISWLVALVVLIAFVLRMYRLDFVSLRCDEAFTLIFVQRTWEGLWKGISTIEPNPPLMYLALRAWIAVAGASEFAARYFSAFFGILCVPLLYRLAREMFWAKAPLAHREASCKEGRSDWAALFAAALIAINPYQIWHSQDIRNYTMWPSLSLLALIFLWRWWKLEIRDWRLETGFRHWCLVIGHLTLYVLLTLASLYTHYYDTFILVAENAFVFALALSARHWQALARWIGAQLVIGGLYAPWVLFGTNRITTYGEASAESGVSLLDVFRRTLASFILSDTVPDDWKARLWFPLAAALAAILFSLAGRHRAPAAFLFLWIALPTLVQYIASLGRPLFLERYLNGIAPAYYITLAVGLAQIQPSVFSIQKTRVLLRHSLCGLAVLFFLLTSAYGLANYYFDPAYTKSPDWRALMQYIKERRAPGDFVIQNFTEMAAIYYRGDLPVLTLPKDYWATPADEQVLRQLNNDYRRIWFIPASPGWWDDGQFVEKFLSRRDERVMETRLDIFRLQLYLTPREFEPQMIPLRARVGNATLVGFRVQGTRNLHLVLYWRAEMPLTKDFTVFVHVTDANSRVVGQHDGVPAFGLHPTTAWQPGESIVDVHEIQMGSAAGMHTLLVGMYDPNTLARAPAFDSNGARLPEDQVGLTQITVGP